MYLTVCPLHAPGHDSSVGELMDLTICPPCGPGSIPGHGGVVQEIPKSGVAPLYGPTWSTGNKKTHF